MITNNNDFLGKELVKTLSYSTAGQERLAYSNVVINGRKYIKMGTLQAVTVVCNIYKLYNSNNGMVEYWAHFGLSKQHPDDIMVNKELGYEVAQYNAMNNPFCILKVNKQFGEHTFRDMIRPYIDDMDLEFVKTSEEKINNLIF